MMKTVVTFTIPEPEAPTPRWLDKILEAHPTKNGVSPVPDMRRAECRSMRSEIHGKTAVLTFEWNGHPTAAGNAFAEWWARAAGWRYTIANSPGGLTAAHNLVSAVLYNPDVNGRPCGDPVNNSRQR
ncbi:MAG TPA: hypothetical protein VLJ59_07645 [Mycobacteriales bacterium]|nr:hypothetical protein [Mycobacteriales bacterium]